MDAPKRLDCGSLAGGMGMKKVLLVAAVLAAAILRVACWAAPDSFRFVILGDRTGEVQPGVYEQVWREAAAEDPAFVVSIGDTIQGEEDPKAVAQWQEVKRILAPYSRFPLYLAPGNHDIWNARSEELFRKYSGHAPHYGFDYGQAHFTILDNSRTEELSEGEMAFLEEDLRAHEKQPVKFIVSHRPSWVLNTVLGNTQFALHQLAKRYGVRYVLAGHVHEMMHFELDGVTYLAMPSAGGHLRGSKRYEDGWFFAQTLAEVRGGDISLQVRELKPPHGEGRVTTLKDWGKMGLAAAGSPR
jgi:Icc protein